MCCCGSWKDVVSREVKKELCLCSYILSSVLFFQINWIKNRTKAAAGTLSDRWRQDANNAQWWCIYFPCWRWGKGRKLGGKWPLMICYIMYMKLIIQTSRWVNIEELFREQRAISSLAPERGVNWVVNCRWWSVNTLAPHWSIAVNHSNVEEGQWNHTWEIIFVLKCHRWISM